MRRPTPPIPKENRKAFKSLEKLPVRMSKLLFFSAGSSLPRMLPLSGPAHVEAVFAHTPGASPGGGAGGGACLLHFLPGDNITLLISEPRDGWHYGQNERTGRYVSWNSQAEIWNCSRASVKPWTV